MRTLIALLFCVSPALADPILRVPYSELEPRLVNRVDFETYPRHLSPGTMLEGVQTFEGASIAERFVGQVITQHQGFDRLTPMAQGPLRLQAGAPGQNLSVSFIFMLSNQLEGLAPPGYPAREASGEGAISILFDRDQFALGFRVAAELPPREAGPARGMMTVTFYRRDGSMIDTMPVELEWGRAAYGFLRNGEERDIAGIAITNSDPAGIAIDDLIFDQDLVLGWLHRTQSPG